MREINSIPTPTVASHREIGVENDLRVSLARKQAKKSASGVNKRKSGHGAHTTTKSFCLRELLARGLERGDWSGQCHPAKST